MVGDREKYIAAGMDDYASKPFDPVQLCATIERCFQNSRFPVGPAVRRGDANVDKCSTSIREPHVDGRPEILPKASSAPSGGFAPELASGLDPAIVDPLRSDKPDLWNRLVGVYLRNTPATLEALEQALSLDDYASITMMAHTLKSSSANMGAVRLAELCRQLELRAVGMTLDGANTLFADIRSEFDVAAAALAPDGENNAPTERSRV